MAIGLIIVGAGMGAVAGAVMVTLGYSIWFALAVYSLVGVGSVLAAALAIAMRPEPLMIAGPDHAYGMVPPQRG